MLNIRGRAPVSYYTKVINHKRVNLFKDNVIALLSYLIISLSLLLNFHTKHKFLGGIF